MKDKKVTKLTWAEVGVLIDELAEKIDEEFGGIYAVPRGGLPIGVALSHKLGIPLLDSPTKDCLIVDDISDNGNTLSKIKGKKIACLYSTPWTKTKPDWFVAMKENKNDWIEYPWEKSMHFEKDI